MVDKVPKSRAAHPPPSSREEEKRYLTLEGLADVDAGRIHDHQSVLLWAAGLDVERTSHPRKRR